MLLFAGFLQERQTENTVEEWLQKKPEIVTIFEKFKTQPETAFKGVLDNFSGASSDSSAVINRSGNILTSGAILKADHFPGCRRMSLLPHLDGVPNYRQVPSRNIYGCTFLLVLSSELIVSLFSVGAIPTVEGIAAVLHYIGYKNKKFTWISLREEPVIYINGRPFVLRDVDSPYANLEYTGISNERVEEIEEQLKKDIIEDSNSYDGRFLVHDEDEGFQLQMFWEQVTPETVLTPRDCYKRLQSLRYPVEYLRIAVTDEQAPQEHEFDTMTDICIKVLQDPSAHLLWNCQMGRGRTTTGMVVATLVDKYLNKALEVSLDSNDFY